MIVPREPAGDTNGKQRSASETGDDDRFWRSMFDPKKQRKGDRGPNQQHQTSSPLAKGSQDQEEIRLVHPEYPQAGECWSGEW